MQPRREAGVQCIGPPVVLGSETLSCFGAEALSCWDLNRDRIGKEGESSALDNRLVIGFCDHPVRRGLTENKDDFSLVGKISSNYF